MIEDRAPQLEAYRKKRDPERTPEPFGGRRAASGRGFVVQKHAARRLHYDFRLEMDGVLKSWAVPKGPSVRAEEKRLAVHVEDHPVEYADFEGVIAPGNYGAGSVIVWDRGWYRSAKPEDLLEQLRRGKLEVELFGFKLRGRWTLARMSGKDKEWLLIKKADGGAGVHELIDRYPQSVLSGLTVEEIADVPGHLEAVRRHVQALDAPREDVAARRQGFMLATLSERVPADKGWLFEIKFDGVRVLASRRGERIELYGRSGQAITGRYPDVVRALLALPVEDFVIDGEIVALDEHGRSSFQRLQPRMALTDPREIARAVDQVPVQAAFFDCLALDGYDLRRLPLTRRKDCLRLLVPPLGPARYVDHVVEHGQAFLDAAAAERLEGIVAKRVDSAYTAGRSREWLKVKCHRRQEFVIGGYTDPQGSRGYFGALHVGVYDGGELVYVSKVGTGLDRATLKRVWDELRPLGRATPPFAAGATPTGRGHHWVEPKLVCEVRFGEWTKDGGIRHPAFLGLRSDKRPEECRREEPLPPPPSQDTPAAPDIPAVAPARTDTMARDVKLTNVKKVFWPDEGYTKGDLIAYYERVAPLLLPYLRDRPLVLTRYPDGIAGKSFFQKDAPEFAPPWVRTERIYSKDSEREIDYFIVDDAATLRYVANSGAIPLHLWASRVGSLERPDWLVLDLDPKGAPFTDVVKVAQALHGILEDLALPSYPKTSGATGLHILIPLGARYPYDDVRTFARLLAVLGVQAVPDISTVARPLRARGGKVYIDFGQNGHGQTIVGPFSLRPLPGAPASCPLDWSEVTARLDPQRFTMATVPRRFEEMADPLAPVLKGRIDMAAAVARIERLMREEQGREGAAAPAAVRKPAKPAAGSRRRARSRPPRA